MLYLFLLRIMSSVLSHECFFCQVLQRLMSAVLATVLRQREAQCPVIRSISRELLTCLVMQPIMNLASPGYVVEYFVLYFFCDNSILGRWIIAISTLCKD